jgi:hypothetical protein
MDKIEPARHAFPEVRSARVCFAGKDQGPTAVIAELSIDQGVGS